MTSTFTLLGIGAAKNKLLKHAKSTIPHCRARTFSVKQQIKMNSTKEKWIASRW